MKQTSPTNKRANADIVTARHRVNSSKPSARPQRHQRRTAAVLSKPNAIPNAAGRHDADLGARQAVVPRKTPISGENMTNRACKVHDAALGAGHNAKALSVGGDVFIRGPPSAWRAPA